MKLSHPTNRKHGDETSTADGRRRKQVLVSVGLKKKKRIIIVLKAVYNLRY